MDSILNTASSHAVVIGIGKYRDPNIPELKYTHADARSFQELLLSEQHTGFKPENVKLLLDEQATLVNIKKAISHWLFQRTAPESTILVFFAGHGGIESDKTGSESDGISKYLLPWDCDKEDLFSSSISNIEFNRLLSTIRSKRIVCFMDACYAGGVTKTGARDIAVTGNPMEKVSQGEGRIVIASAKPSQRSWEDQTIGHGIFTYHLLEALKGKADTDNDGYVSIVEVFKYLEKTVPQSVRQLAQSIQEPLLSGDLSNDIYLTANAVRVVEKKDAQIKEEEERKAIAREKQRKLFGLYEEGQLTDDVYQEALKLLKKSPETFTDIERKLFKNLEALLRGGIDAGMYSDNRASIVDNFQPAVDRGSFKEPTPPPPPVDNTNTSTRSFCTNCGKTLQQGLQFCTNCGKRL